MSEETQASQRKSLFYISMGIRIEGVSFEDATKALIERTPLSITNVDTGESKMVHITEMSWVSEDFARFTWRDENRYVSYIFMELHQDPVVAWVTRWSDYDWPFPK